MPVWQLHDLSRGTSPCTLQPFSLCIRVQQSTWEAGPQQPQLCLGKPSLNPPQRPNPGCAAPTRPARLALIPPRQKAPGSRPRCPQLEQTFEGALTCAPNSRTPPLPCCCRLSCVGHASIRPGAAGGHRDLHPPRRPSRGLRWRDTHTCAGSLLCAQGLRPGSRVQGSGVCLPARPSAFHG